ncbi:MAG: hypothetical protein FWH51_04735 [Dehalococcoidia bacterium]|nr:hypothetical protein [Dehalococcoidia bacterium]MCL2150216.1 hypothetical protein [Dehalococcoidia bacterium]
MRLLNGNSEDRLENVIIYLKKNEVVFLIGALENLLNAEEKGMGHYHVNDSDYTHEITVAMYDENNLDRFDQRSQKLILEDN